MGENDRRLKRLITECLEVSFVICNDDMEEYSASKIFDVFDQIFPTAHVLNTGYWPFYSSSHGNSLCVCGRFGFYCRHRMNKNHWIDISGVEHGPGQQVFFPKYYGPVYPVELNIFIKALPVGGQTGQEINIVIKVQYRKKPGNKREKHKLPNETPSSSPGRNVDIYGETFKLLIISRYYLTTRFYPATATIIFKPNPFYHQYYSSYFKDLLEDRQADPDLRKTTSQSYLCAANRMLPVTFRCQYVNLPVALLEPSIVAFNVSSSEASAIRQLPNASIQFSEPYSDFDLDSWNDYHNSICARCESTIMKNVVRIISVDTYVIEGFREVDSPNSNGDVTSSSEVNSSASSGGDISSHNAAGPSYRQVLKSRAKHLILPPNVVEKLTRMRLQDETIPSTSGLQNSSDDQSYEPSQDQNQSSDDDSVWLADPTMCVDQNLEVIDSILLEDANMQEGDLDEEETGN